jgi:hypothetical protein
MLLNKRFIVIVITVPDAGIKCPSSLKFMIPDERMLCAVSASLVR